MTVPATDAAVPPAHRPLEGLVVVDLSRHLPGPLVGRILGDLGARVIKVEEPNAGDPVRYLAAGSGGVGALAAMLLAGHESIALDLGREAAREVFEALLEGADVLVESFRPGKLATFGLSPEALRRRHPGLVICSVSGWGQTGPHAGRAGHDLSYQAVGGSLAPTASLPAVPVADLVGGSSAASAVLAALYRRQRSGVGCWIDAALLDAASFANLTNWADNTGGDKAVGERGLLTGAWAGYGVYRTRDGGRVALAALEPHFWRRFCAAVERRGWRSRYRENDRALREEVAAVIAERTRDEWSALFAEHDIPGEAVLSAAESLAHPQVEARSMVAMADDGLPRIAFPALIDGERPRSSAVVPILGGDTDVIASELGFEGRRRGVGRRRRLRRFLYGARHFWRKRRDITS